MVTKNEKKSRVKVGALKVNKENVKELTPKEKKGVKGGGFGQANATAACPIPTSLCNSGGGDGR